MTPVRAAFLATLSFALPLGAAAAVDLNVTGEARQEVVTPAFQDRYRALAAYLAASVGTDVKLAIGHDPTRELQKMRAAPVSRVCNASFQAIS